MPQDTSQTLSNKINTEVGTFEQRLSQEEWIQVLEAILEKTQARLDAVQDAERDGGPEGTTDPSGQAGFTKNPTPGQPGFDPTRKNPR